MAEFVNKIEKLILKTIIHFDPPPKIKRGVSIQDWLKRIDLKYAIREVKLMKLSTPDIDYEEHAELIKGLTRKSDIKDMRKLARICQTLEELNNDCYQIVLRRKEAGR